MGDRTRDSIYVNR